MRTRPQHIGIAIALIIALFGGSYAAKELLRSGAATNQVSNTPTTTTKPVMAIYYLWWTNPHWHDLLGASYPYAQSPNPLPATLDANSCGTVNKYSGNRLTDVSQKLAYDQNKASVIESDVRAAAAHGISGFSVNWKGTGTSTQTPTSNGFNQRLQYLFDAVKKVNAEGIKFKVQLNYQASAAILSTSWITNDLNYYISHYGSSSAQDHAFSPRPEVIWTGSWKYPDAAVTTVSKAVRSRLFLIGDEKVATWNANAAANFDGDSYYWSSQDPYGNPQSFTQLRNLAANVRSTKNPDGSAKVWIAPFSPGFNAQLRYGSSGCVPRNSGDTIHKLFDGNSTSNPNGWMFISWNEIAEGTYITPLTRYGNLYLNTIANVINGGSPLPPPPPPVTTPTTTPTPPPPPPVTTTTPTPTSTASKVLVFIEENHSLDQMKAGMPFLYSQAQKFGYATDYTAMIHPSLGNYLAIAFGNTFGVTDDQGVTSHPQTAPDVFTNAIKAGRTAVSYQESMGANCSATNSNGYAVKHNPWAYAVTSASHTACLAHDIPSGTSASGALHDDIANGNLPNVGEVTPNLNNDAHDGSLATADNWLKSWMTLIYASPDWKSGHLTVIVTADEDASNQGNKVLTTVIDPSQSGKVVTTALNHYSLTGLLSQFGHSPCIANGCTAPSFASAFGLSVS